MIHFATRGFILFALLVSGCVDAPSIPFGEEEVERAYQDVLAANEEFAPMVLSRSRNEYLECRIETDNGVKALFRYPDTVEHQRSAALSSIDYDGILTLYPNPQYGVEPALVFVAPWRGASFDCGFDYLENPIIVVGYTLLHDIPTERGFADGEANVLKNGLAVIDEENELFLGTRAP